MCQVWCLIVSIPDLCPLSYFGTLICKFLAIHNWLNGDSEIDNIWLAAEKGANTPFSIIISNTLYLKGVKRRYHGVKCKGDQCRQMQ